MLFSVSPVSPSLARVAFLICLTFVLQQPGVLALKTKRPFYSTWYDWGWYGLYPQRSYQSSGLLSPLFNFRTWQSECNDHGYVLLEPRGLLVTQPGPVITDKQGNLVWKGAEWGEVMDFKVQVYQSQQVLTFWVGEDSGTFGQGRYIIVIREVSAANGRFGDLHEFKITSDGTALLTSYVQTPADLSHFDISTQGWIYESVFQEIDIATGTLLFEWRASNHYSFNDTYASPSALGELATEPSTAFDWFHINSIDKDTDGNYYISSRYLHTVSCINDTSGEVLWTLGGKRNEFTDVSPTGMFASNIAWNHHATYLGNETLTVFDNAKAKGMSRNDPPSSQYSRRVLAKLDPTNKIVELLQEFPHPRGWTAQSQGSVQILPSANVLVGWGYIPGYTEFSSAGKPLCDVQFAPTMISTLGWVKNYRTAQNDEWVGRPGTRPAVKVFRDLFSRSAMGKLSVSWNGATEVARWVLQGVDAPIGAWPEAVFQNVMEIERNGFENVFELDKIEYEVPQYVRVAALDSDEKVLGVSHVLDKTREATLAVPWTIMTVVLTASCFLFYKVWRKRQLLLQPVMRKICTQKVLRHTALGSWLVQSYEKEDDIIEYQQMLYHDEDVPGMDLNEMNGDGRGKQE
ncbi:hypothetical protein LTR24_000951 [Lithohypha guttulata]|uniref:ASST-domain-containing protein n=1 Tax=Lithohypha guttulata TaxID=1690604 RepID=A0ABR0KMX0_9EURO|nr:hypothetical protein LTR24_000951 [Lithohypha guttulata]